METVTISLGVPWLYFALGVVTGWVTLFIIAGLVKGSAKDKPDAK